MSKGDGGGGDPMGGGGGGGDKGGASTAPVSEASSSDSKGSGQGQGGLADKGSSGASAGGDSMGTGFGSEAGAGPAMGSTELGFGDTGSTDSGLAGWLENPAGGNLADPGPVGGAPDLFGSSTAPTVGANAFAAPAGVGGNADLTSAYSVEGTGFDPSAYTTEATNDFIGGATEPAGSGTDLAALVGGSSAPGLPGGLPTDTASAPASGSTLPVAGGGVGTGAGTTVGSSSSGGGAKEGGFFESMKLTPSSVIAGGGLLNNLINGNGSSANVNALNSLAQNNASFTASQTDAGKALQQYIANGTLPEGYEAQVQAGMQSAKQRIISNHAQRGLPTDPTKNSVLAQELSQVDAQLPMMREQLAAKLAEAGGNMISQGLQASGISSSVYQTLAKLEEERKKSQGAAIANFAAALNSGTKNKAA